MRGHWNRVVLKLSGEAFADPVTGFGIHGATVARRGPAAGTRAKTLAPSPRGSRRRRGCARPLASSSNAASAASARAGRRFHAATRPAAA